MLLPVGIIVYHGLFQPQNCRGTKGWLCEYEILEPMTVVPSKTWKRESEVAQSCPTLWTPWSVAYQAPPAMGFSRQEYWSGLPFPSPGDHPNPGIEPSSPHCRQIDALPSELPGKTEEKWKKERKETASNLGGKKYHFYF